MLGNKIAEARRAKGWAQKDLAERVGTSQQTIQRYEAGTRNLKASMLARISDALDVTVAYLLGMTDPENQRPDSVEVPLYSAIAAGSPLEMDNADDLYPIPYAVYERFPRAFLLRVEGESMNRILPNGCYALIAPCDEIEFDDQPYAIRVGDLDATVKRVRRLEGGAYELVPDSNNPTFKSQQLTGNASNDTAFSVIGRVVWHCLPPEWAY